MSIAEIFTARMSTTEMERRLRDAMRDMDAAGRRALMDALEAVAKGSTMRNLQAAARSILTAA